MSQSGYFPHRGVEHLLSIPMEIVTSLYLIVAVFYLILALIQTLQQFHCQWQAFIANRPRQAHGRVSDSYRNDPRNRYLQSDLLILVKGDVATAKRLLAQQRRKSPGQSDNWYLEKVIYDLERDRH